MESQYFSFLLIHMEKQRESKNFHEQTLKFLFLYIQHAAKSKEQT